MRLKKYHFRFSAELVFGALLSLSLLPSHAFAQAPFYQGKTITIIQGREPGGTGDMRVRQSYRKLQGHPLESAIKVYLG
jgi:hypothetical protein